MKVFIAGGAGTLGSCIAQALAGGALADEIVLYDVNRGLACNHAMDLLESVCLTSRAAVYAGALSDLQGSDIVIPVINIGSSSDHMKNFEQTAPVFFEFAAGMKSEAPEAVVITPSNPVDLYNGLLCRRAGLPAGKLLGYSYNDTVRFRRALGSVLGLPPARISAYVMGEHGATKVPIFSSIEVDGKPFALTSKQEAAVREEMAAWWDLYLNNTSDKRTAGWVTAFGVAEMVRRIRGLDDSPIPCSCVLEGQYGLSGVSVGVPARLSRQGVSEIVELPLRPDEREAFEASAAKIKKLTIEN